MEKYNQIVNEWYVGLRSLFINYIHKRLPALRIEDIEDVYTETFIAVRQNLLNNKVASGTNWKAYIFQIGYNMSINKMKQESKLVQASDRPSDDDVDADEKFQTQMSLQDLIDDSDDKEQAEQRIAVLRREMTYLPEPCETILKDFYFGGFSMAEIMDEIHYNSVASVKSMKNRCMNKFKERVRVAFKMLNLID
ncbi:MAG: sigma-70 family RNA polymerase sigma factor [Muribaculaceae bacterium]|nr:sigma-70 family RNA polymerase sigma factor [Muribaculaceae bacterium]